MSDAHNTLAAGLSLAAALAFAVASVAQQHAAARISDEQAKGGGLITGLLSSPLWWAGTLGSAFGYGLQAVALVFGSLLLVQPLIVASLLFAMPISARFTNRTLHGVDVAWGLALCTALAVFTILGNPGLGDSRARPARWGVVLLVGAPVVLGCIYLARQLRGSPRASVLAIPAGALAGVAAVLTKSVVGLIGDGAGALFSSGEFYTLFVVGAAGIYLQQVSFQAGALQASLPIIMVIEPMIATMLGFALLNEHLQVNKRGSAALVVAVAVMVVATVMVARGEGAAEQAAAEVSPVA